MLVAIEGIDGSGKGTQAARLKESLAAKGFSATVVSFPRYTETSFGKKIGDFLNGRFGQLDEVNPFLIATLYAGDRLESKPYLQTLLTQNDVVICDRYVASNLAHQAAKLVGDEQQEIIDWISHVEFEIHRLPHAGINILLDLPATVAQELIQKKSARDYTELAADLHESDGTYLANVSAVYRMLAQEQKSWRSIKCWNEASGLRPVEAITEELTSLVLEQLSQ